MICSRISSLEQMDPLYNHNIKYSRSTSLPWYPKDKGYKIPLETTLEKGAHLEAEDEEECTPGISAARNGHEDVVKLLIEKGADLQHDDENWCTTRANATPEGHEGVVRLLREVGSDLKSAA